MYLGYSAAEQKQFLSSDKKVRSQVCVMVELWFSDTIYPFITEGTKRFSQMKMSPPIKGTAVNLPKSVFLLRQTEDKNFPHRFQVILPKWARARF